MVSRSFFLRSLLALSIAAPLVAVGCAAPTSEEDGESAEASQDELTATAKQLVGSYWTHSPSFGGFARLKLESTGKYTSQVDPEGKVVCIQSPCLVPESGTWNAAKTAGGYRLRISAAGKSVRYYDAVKSAGDLTLKRLGQTQTLHTLGANACLDSADCGPTEECGPKVCLMWCEVNDPFCCGTSTCQPKNPPPPPKCWGAWLDENGLCRTPADGAYPDACCEGQSNPCGGAKCGPGTACCNPLDSICTPLGMACTL